MSTNEQVHPLVDQTRQLLSLFTSHSLYPQLKQAVYDRHPAMRFDFHAELMDRLRMLLPAYNGAETEPDLLAWAELQERTDPDVWLLCAHADCQPFILSAIWKTLGHSIEPSKYDDYPETVQELATDTWTWVLENFGKLMIPGRAKLSTRLYARARNITRAWLKKQRTRRAAVIRKVHNMPTKAAAQRRAQELDAEATKRAVEEREMAGIRAEMETALAAD